jgi:hypothetical protein
MRYHVVAGVCVCVRPTKTITESSVVVFTCRSRVTAASSQPDAWQASRYRLAIDSILSRFSLNLSYRNDRICVGI